MGREHAARAGMDDERAAREALRRGANPSFVDRAREEAARAGARDDAGARTTTKVRRHRAGKSVEARDEEEEEEEDALGFAKPSAAGTRGRAAEAAVSYTHLTLPTKA